jgi:hypothetical protein
MGIIYILMILFEDGIDYVFSVSLALVLAIIFNISLAFFIFNNAKRRQLDNERIWALLTGVFGLPVAILYLLMNIKLGVKNEDVPLKKLQKRTLIICAAVLVISTVIYPVYKYEDKKVILNHQYEDSIHMPYLSEDESQYLFYDKTGKVYHFYDEENIPYYTENGEKLTEEYDEEDDCYKYMSSDKRIVIEKGNAFIDADGNMVEKEEIELKMIGVPTDDSTYSGGLIDRDDEFGTYAYTDSKGNLFFDPDECSWDKNGNLVFRNENLSKYYEKNK